MKAVEEFFKTLDKLIIEENYLPEEIFNVDDASIFLKWMPESSFMYKKASQCQVSRLLRTE